MVHSDLITLLDALSFMRARPDFFVWFYLVFAVSSTLFPSASDRRAWLPVAAFLVFMVIGAVLGMRGIGLPGIETGIAASVLVMGLLVATLVRLPTVATVALIGVFALFHGSAHGAEMPSSATPLLYGIGFLVATASLHLGGIGLARLLQRSHAEWLFRGAGIVTSGFGAWLLLGV